MEGKGTSFVLHVTLLCLTIYFGSHAQILDGPKDLTVLTGSNASFLCTVARDWASITWTVNNLFVVSISPTAGSMSDTDIIVRNSTNQVNLAFTSEITILSVDRTRSGKVQCSLLFYGFQEATLTVQVNGSLEITNGSITIRPNIPVYLSCRFLNWFPVPEITWRINETTANQLSYTTDYVYGNDQMVNGASLLNITAEYKTTVTCLAKIETLVSPQSTSVDVTVSDNISGSLDQTTIIIIAVCVSVGCLLIIIIIVVTVVCCSKKKKRDTSYQSDAWKVSSIKSDYLQTSQNGRAGENNLSYTPEPSSRISYANSDNSVIFAVAPMRHTLEQAPEYRRPATNPTTVRHITHV
uniref:Ig-like domain-containing protein n=1 Tax=Leptobrachium leishanense TaxID=445787 RepID=A0A8C5M353_9ANUR